MKGVTDIGNRQAPAIVLLHGGVINRHMWLPVAAELEERYRLVMIDLPGHGDLSGIAFTVDAAVEQVIAVMDELEMEAAALVGLSLGGYIAQAVAADHPHRVEGLVLSGATIRYLGWDGLSTRLYGFAFPLLARPAKKAFARKMREDLGNEVADAIIDGSLSMKGGAQALRRLPGRDYAELMGRYPGPIVVANGERDESNRDGEAGFKDRFPEASIVVIEDAGHACALQQPKAFAEAIGLLMGSSSSDDGAEEKHPRPEGRQHQDGVANH